MVTLDVQVGSPYHSYVVHSTSLSHAASRDFRNYQVELLYITLDLIVMADFAQHLEFLATFRGTASDLNIQALVEWTRCTNLKLLMNY